MKRQKKVVPLLDSINDDWFYRDPPAILKILTIFVWGDALVILPWIALCLIVTAVHVEVGVILFLIGLCLRFFGEMMYWFLQQFGPKTYRPYDYGLKNLSNNSIYIIYQLTSTFTTAIFLLVLIMILKQ